MSLTKILLKESSLWYHGTYNGNNFILNKEKPIFLSKEKNVAKFYAGQNQDSFFNSDNKLGKVIKFEVDLDNANILELTAEEYFELKYKGNWKEKWEIYGSDYFDDIDWEEENDKLIEEALQKGFDCIYIRGDYEATPLEDLDYDQIIILNHDIIKKV